MQANETLVRRQVLTLESLRVLVNIELNVHTECYAAAMEPCRSQLRGVIAQLRERYNVEQ
jgi:hypothetical protein